MDNHNVTAENDLSALLSTESLVAIAFHANGEISSRTGGFVPDQFAACSKITDSCDFVFGVPETMSVDEQLNLDGMHFTSAGGESFIVDVILRCHADDTFSMVIEDHTDKYKLINQIGQQRNEADIFHHKLARQNDQLKLLKQAAESASQTRTEFLAKVSHEIRTPLNALLGFAKILNETKLNSKQQRHLDHIHTAGNALSGLLNDVLDLSKMESGKYHIELAPLLVSSVVEDAAALSKAKAEQKGLELVWSVDPNIPTRLAGDQLRISQVLLNLLTNAIKFTDSGSVSIDARCGEVSPVSAAVQIEVSDTGRGIPLEQQSQIFERFSQTQLADSTELGGVGLGLAIVRQLVEAMDGEISVSSKPGAGASFTVILPLKRLPEEISADNEASVVDDRAESITPGKQDRDLEGFCILVAEDSTLNQQYVRELLTPHRADLRIVDTGLAAVQALLSEPVDLVLMDIHMPEMNGDDAIRQIRQQFLFPLSRIPIVVFTGRASEREQSALIDIGASQTLAKPFSPANLFDAIAS